MTLYSPTPDKDHTKNMAIALVMCALLIVGWQFFIEIPKRAKLAEWHKQQEVLVVKQVQQKKAATIAKQQAALSNETAQEAPAPRIHISSDTLHGSISQRGLRMDALTLARYKETLDKGSPEVQLLKSRDTDLPYFMQFGWLSDDKNVTLPTANTLWQTSQQILSPDAPLTLEWNNGKGISFYVTLSLDEHYMFTIDQQVLNQSGREVSIKPYALLNRTEALEEKKEGDNAQNFDMMIHRGPIGVLAGKLTEITYDNLKEDKQQFNGQGGWIGFTDKYWLTALIPSQKQSFIANFSSYEAKEKQRFQTDYVGPEIGLVDGERGRNKMHFFAGAKKVDVLDHYTAGVDALDLAVVPLFDRSVDFGWLYFLTKPIFQALHFLYGLVGNFGLAIILLTFCIKLMLFPLANKGYKSMTAMRALQPELAAIKEKHADDRVKAQQEIMALWKREKVNPASGCLPMLIQLPIFFALYKVLLVTIEMRHAPFWGPWQDLSAQDPTNLFEGFGLFTWDHPSFLMLGVLPILMCISMMVQMHQQPTPQDPMQAKVMKFMPWMLLIFVARMPAGLVLYWVVSNVLSILQQAVITRKYNATHPNKQVSEL